MSVNDLNCALLKEAKKEVVNFLEALYIMSARDVVEYDMGDESSRKFKDYLTMCLHN